MNNGFSILKDGVIDVGLCTRCGSKVFPKRAWEKTIAEIKRAFGGKI